MNILDKIRNEQVRDDRAEFGIGDTVKVSVKIVEGDNERIQAFQGTVISRHGSGVEETFTVRRVQAGQGVERVFPVNSPRIEKIEVIRRGDVRRAKLYYLRDKIGKAARVKELRTKYICGQIERDELVNFIQNTYVPAYQPVMDIYAQNGLNK